MISALLIGCSHFEQQQIDAGARLGAAVVLPANDSLPAECKGPVRKLTLRLGEGAWGVVQRYEHYVEGPISDLLSRCWQLHEDQLIRTVGP